MAQDDIPYLSDDMGNIIPDAVQLASNSLIADYKDNAAALRAQCGGLADLIKSDIDSGIASCRAICAEMHGNCVSCYLAEISQAQSKLAFVGEACKNQVNAYLNQLMANALQEIQSLGIEPPTEDQIAAAFRGEPNDIADVRTTTTTTNDPTTIECPIGFTSRAGPNGVIGCFPNEVTINDPTGPITVNPPPIITGKPIDASGDPPICPTGTHPVYDPLNKEWYCATDGGTTPPPNPPPNPPPPPPVPPPPPPVPPPGGGVINGPDGCCFVPPPCGSSIGGCEIGWTIPPMPFWAVCDLSDCASVKVKIYNCYTPPPVGPGQVVQGPFDQVPDCTTLCPPTLPICVPPQPPPVPPPPPPPPPNPPPPPPPPPPPYCPPGYHLDENGICVKDDTGCMPGYHIDPDTGECIPDDFKCPDGYHYNPQTGACDPDNPVPPPPPTKVNAIQICSPDNLVKFVESRGNRGEPVVDVPVNFGPSVLDCEPGSVTNPLGYVCEFFDAFISQGSDYLKQFVNLTGCLSINYIESLVASSSLNMFGGWFGLIPESLRQINQYAMNADCQYLIPTGNEFNALSARGWITDEEWSAGIKANGLCIPWQTIIRDASYRYLSVDEAIAANRRGLTDNSSLESTLILNGVNDKPTRDILCKLTEYVPGPGDIVRFMVRDVFDNQVVSDLQLDDEFNDKFTGDALQFAKSQGISSDIFKYFWRSHWQLPSAGQMYDALHRIRDDIKLPDSEEIASAVTVEEVAKTLKINDMSPAWVNRLVALSYSPYQKRDFQRLYANNILNDAELKSAIMDTGYDDKKSDKLVSLYKAITAQARAQIDGSPSVKDVLKLYDQAGLSLQQTNTALVLAGLTPEQASNRIDTADAMRNARNQVANIKAVRRKFMQGDYDISDAQTRLTDYGLEGPRVSEITSQWKEELSLKYKQPTIAALCAWTTKGYIDATEYLRRMGNLGYANADAANYLAACVSDFAKKIAKEAVASARQQAADKAKKEAADKKAALDALPCKPPPKPVCETNGQPAGT